MSKETTPSQGTLYINPIINGEPEDVALEKQPSVAVQNIGHKKIFGDWANQNESSRSEGLLLIAQMLAAAGSDSQPFPGGHAYRCVITTYLDNKQLGIYANAAILVSKEIPLVAGQPDTTDIEGQAIITIG